MRLVYLTSSLNVGGAEALLVELVDRLRKKGFEQHVVYFHGGPHVKRIQNLGIPTYHVKGLVCLYDPLFFLRLFFLIRRLKPDCLHTLLWAANFAGRLISGILKIPVVAALHNNIDQNGWIRMWLDRFTTYKACTLITVSEGVKQSLLQCFPAIHLPSIKVITNGIDARRIEKDGLQFSKKRTDLGYSDKHFIIGSVGRFVPLKNYPLLIEQLAQVVDDFPHVRFILIGVGSQEEYLKKKIKELGIEKVVRIIVNKRALAYYPLFDCFVQPSFKEGVSIALLEAMSFRLPCVVGNHISEHAVIQSELNGLIVTPGQSFALALRLLIEQPVLRQSLGNQARVTVQERFSLDMMVTAYAKIFGGFLNRI